MKFYFTAILGFLLILVAISAYVFFGNKLKNPEPACVLVGLIGAVVLVGSMDTKDNES